MTREERRLWYDFLKGLPVTIHRQKVFPPYIVDFYCAEAKLVIELYGSQHYGEAHAQNDLERDAALRARGLTVLRYPDSLIHQEFQAVCRDIWNHIPRLANSVS